MGDDPNEWEKLPTLEKCLHKSWKARVAGYEEAMKEFKKLSSDSPKFSEYLGGIKKFILDTNANAQEKGCEAALMYVEKADCAKKAVRDVVSGVVVKGLNGKPKTKDYCAKIVMMCIEIEKIVEAREEILEGFSSKQPKVIAASVNIVTQCLNQFGSKVFPLKPLIKKEILKPILEHKDGKVRDEGKSLVTEMYRWIGPTLPKLLTCLELKDVLLKELEEEWGKTEKGVPERYTRSEQARMEEAGEEEEEEADGGGGGGDDEGGEEAEDEDMDPYDLATPVDILKSLNKDCPQFNSMLVDKSWKIRKEALDSLLPLAENTIRIENSNDFGSIITPLCKIVAKDNNIVVCQLSVRCLAGIAKGLRKGYSSHSKETIIACLAKYKEKKPAVVALLSNCIDHAMDATQLTNVYEHMIESMGDKNPGIRQETTNFCTRIFQRSKATSLPKPVMKALCGALKTLFDDSVGPIRDAAAQALGTATKVVGEKFMSEYINDLDNIKKGKVTEWQEKAEVKYPYGAKGPAKATAKPKAEPKKEAPKKEAPKKEASKKAPPKKAGPAKKAGAKKAAAPKKESKADKQKERDSDEIKEPEMTDEQVDEAVQDLLSADIISGLSSANWKMRLEAVQGFSTKVEGFDSSVKLQALVQLLGRKPGWKDNNAQVLNEKFGICQKLAKKGDNFTKRCADYAIPGMVEKIGDIKLNKQITATLTTIAETISLNFTSVTVFRYAEKQKSPKVHTETLNWLTESIKLFGMVINIKAHLSYMKTCVGSPNAQIRGAALNLIGTIAMYKGAAILAAFADTDNKTTLSSIESTIEKFKGETPPAPTLGLRSDESAGGDDAAEGETAVVDDDECDGMEDLIERKNISDDLNKAAESINSTVWKERAAALDSISNLIDSAKNIKPDLGSDFIVGMKARLSDNNMAVKTKAIAVTNALGKALGPGTKQHKEILELLFPLLSDSKKHVQAQVLDAINVWIEHVKLRTLLVDESLVASTTDNSPNIRIALFNWLPEQIKNTKVPPKMPKEIGLLVPGLYKSLEDRNPEVRKAAQATLPYIMAHLGFSGMVSKMECLDAKSKSTIQDILDKNKEQAEALAPKKPPPKPKAEPKKPAKKPVKPPVDEEEVDGSAGDSSPVPQKKQPPKKVLGKKPAAPVGGANKKKKGEEEDTDSPLKSNDKKTQRFKDEASLKVLKWNFKVPRQEYNDQLQELMEPVCSAGLFSKLFHADFKQHNEALKILIGIIPTHLTEIKQSLDLLLKWISLRFFDTNTSVLLNSLEFLSKCFAALREDDYILLDQEGHDFMPYLITKLGDSKEPVRKSVQLLFNELSFIYPASKTFVHLTEGLKTKNSRQRSGVLEQQTRLINENGITVCQPSVKKTFEYVASFIGDKDTSVRMGALNCCVAGWNFIGKDIYKLCGSLSDKDLGMLEERVKRAGKRVESPPKPKTSQERSTDSITRNGSAMDQSKPKPDVPSEPVAVEEVEVEVEPEREPTPPPPPPPKKRGEFYINYENLAPVSLPTHNGLEKLNVDDLVDFQMPDFNFKYNPVEQNLEGIDFSSLDGINFEMVEKIGNLRHPMIHVVIETVSDLNGMLKHPQKCLLFKNYVNNLIMTATSQLTHFPNGDDEQELTVYRAITSIIMQVINHEELAQEISTKYISRIFKLFLVVLCDDTKQTGALESLMKGVNALVLRLIMNCNTGRAICALVSHMDSILDKDGVCRVAKELEILLKCLWKLMSRLEKDFNLTLSERQDLLTLIAHFLQRLPSHIWRDEHENDKPYRTIKTLVHRFCKCSGVQVLSDMESLSEEDAKTLRTHVDTFLTALGHDVNQNCGGIEAPNANQTVKLEELFEKLKEKEQIRSALQQLHIFTKENHNVNIKPYLDTLQDVKRRLVEKILADLKKRDNNKLQGHRNKLQIIAEKQGVPCIKDLNEEQVNNLNSKPLSDIINKDTKNILLSHKKTFPDASKDVDELLEQFPKDPVTKKSRLPMSHSIPRPVTSTTTNGRSPVKSGSGVPSRSMDDLKKRLEMIKQRSKPT